MGGPGSGCRNQRWRPEKKTVVEECRQLDVRRWARQVLDRTDASPTGRWEWTFLGGATCSIGYEVLVRDRTPYALRLSYTRTVVWFGKPEELAYVVRLTTTAGPLGRPRWWFLCPLLVDGQPCDRRVGKLYLPRRARYFGCRQCHNLTYTTCPTRDPLFRLLRPWPVTLTGMRAK
jgi:hypothetical protein